MTIGDKGRAQLQRVAPEQIKLSVADTYKEKVTFSQVSLMRGGGGCLAAACSIDHGNSSRCTGCGGRLGQGWVCSTAHLTEEPLSETSSH